jgi:mxaA protein
MLLAAAAVLMTWQATAQVPSAGVPVASAVDGQKPAAAPPPNATVVQPRAFGYVIGDLLTQRVLLDLNGREFAPAELPSPGRAGVWFERRRIRVDEDSRGRRWLNVDYQLMNSPQALRVVTLPAWKLASADPAAGELRVGEWPISVAPLTLERPVARAGLGSLRPDRVAPSVAIAPMQRGVTAGIAGLVLTGLAWVAWLAWRNWKASAAQPFARAIREMRGLDGASPEAWHALHRAFDGAAGRAMRAETLPDLFRRAPQFEPLRSPIEEFFRQSAARFFAGLTITTPLSAQALCRELRRIEKRHER